MVEPTREQTLGLFEEFIKRFNEYDLDGIAEMLTDDFVQHLGPQRDYDKAGYTGVNQKLLEAGGWPPLVPDDIVIEGDRAAARVGAMMAILRFEGSRVAEMWEFIHTDFDWSFDEGAPRPSR